VTQAQLSVAAVPDATRGALELRLLGEGRCDRSVATKGNVTLFGNAVPQLDGRVRLLIDGDSLQVLPAVANCRVDSRILDVHADRRIVERIARRRAPKLLPEAEAEAARLAEKRLAERMDKEAGAMIAQANKVYNEIFRLTLLRTGAWPRIASASDNEGVYVQMLQADAFQLAAPHAPPAWRGDGDLVFCFHESMLENLLERLLGGRELHGQKILQLMELLTGESPRALWVHDRAERWSLRLSPERPFRFAFQDGELRIALSLAETVRGERRLTAPAVASAAFHVSPTVDGPVFRRLGDVKLTLDDSQLNPAEAASLRKFLTRKFDAILPAELHFDGLAAPAGGFGDRIRALQPQLLKFADGWAIVSYRLYAAQSDATLVSLPDAKSQKSP
jgi:hypothetical protein